MQLKQAMESDNLKAEVLRRMRAAATPDAHPYVKENKPDVTPSIALALENSACQIGMPPVPKTLRGRIGSYVVRVVQRILFWYTPQIVSTNVLMIRAIEDRRQKLDQLSGKIDRLAHLESENARRSTIRVTFSFPAV